MYPKSETEEGYRKVTERQLVKRFRCTQPSCLRTDKCVPDTMGNRSGIVQNSDAGTETNRQDSQTGTITGDDRRDRQEVRHLEHVTGHESARTVQNRQEGQTGTEADSHRHRTGSASGSVSDRTAQPTENTFASAYPHTTDEPAATDPEQLAASYGQVSSTVSSPDSGIVDETRLTQSPGQITSIFGNESGYREPNDSAQPVSDEPSNDRNNNRRSGYCDTPYPYSSQRRTVTELSRKESGSILRRRAPTENPANMGVEADTKSPRNKGHIGTDEGCGDVTDLSIGKLDYNDAQCAVNIGSLSYNNKNNILRKNYDRECKTLIINN